MSFNKKLGSYPGILITISLTVALFLIGFCGWIAISSKELIRYVKQNIEIQVYLDRNLEQAELEKIKSKIESLNIADIKDNKQEIKLTTKEKAAEIFYQDTKENFKDVLGDNPFRDSYSVRLKEENITEEKLKLFKVEIEKINGVFEVEYAKDFLKGIISNVNKVYKILALIVVIFFVATLLLINNTIKLALYSQRFIIRTMQLVGATDFFIQKPFLIKGFIQGLIASFISISLIYVTKYVSTSQIDGLNLIQNDKAVLFLFFILLVLGPTIGVLSTFQSIVRYHKMDLDKLY
ncbi:FtsX-like permease family protein [Lacihabitans sp. LS3-19]|uniref:cell division protein FtsX n=1 Tax=Lacihabitans sp. LS3-19 TaxID=2487335 RepID=UPI0020CBC0AC|nr:permease-like cell division protein FtsX [Lacihabitans sp. LS3-19]MCP9767630.1 FtsX-like permease family protein [Lacihabitans sp. LS3-19]